MAKLKKSKVRNKTLWLPGQVFPMDLYKFSGDHYRLWDGNDREWKTRKKGSPFKLNAFITAAEARKRFPAAFKSRQKGL